MIEINMETIVIAVLVILNIGVICYNKKYYKNKRYPWE